MKQEKTKQTGEAGRMEQQVRDLQMTIQRNESIIHMLKMQIQQLNKEPSVTDSVSTVKFLNFQTQETLL